MPELHLANHFPIPIAINACRGKRTGSTCSPDCLGHFSSWWPARDNYQILASLPLLPTVRKITGGETNVDWSTEPIEFALYETGSALRNDTGESASVFALVVLEPQDGELTICLVPTVSAGLAELGRILERSR